MMSVISYRAPAPGWWVRPRYTDHPSATGGPLGVFWGLWFSTGHIGNLGGAVLLVVTMIGGLTGTLWVLPGTLDIWPCSG